jgi:hypothetical protein
MISSSQIPGLVVVVFGSAARRVVERDDGVSPRDIDAVYRYDGSDAEIRAHAEEHAREAVERWAAANGLGGLPIDLHRTYESEIRLPSAFGIEGSCVVLRGDVKPKWRDHTGIASAIRAFGGDAEALRSALLAGQPNFFHAAGVWEISLDPRSEHPQWDESYCNGVEAIRSAMFHAAPGVWTEATKGLPWARLVDALLARGADDVGVETARRRSSGGGARIFVRHVDGRDEAWTQYGHEKYTIDDATNLFVRPLPVLLNTSIITGLPADLGEATYSIRKISPEQAREITAGGFTSAIGHDAAARAMTTVLGATVPVNRVPSAQRVGQKAIVLKVRGRLPEGAILDDAALAEIGFDLFLLTRTT